MTDQNQGIDLTLFEDDHIEVTRTALSKLIFDYKVAERTTAINYRLHKSLGNTEMVELLEKQQKQHLQVLDQLRAQAEAFNKSLNGHKDKP